MSHMDFSSWPRDQEQSFVVYEQRNAESSKKAFTIGGVVGLAWLVIMVGVYMAVPPEHKDMTKGMNMDNLTKKSKKTSEAAAPTPAPKAEPKPAEAAPAAAPEAEKPAEPAAAEEKK